MRSQIFSDRERIDKIINSCEICHVALVTPEGNPYIVAMNFAYDGSYLYIHSAPDGKKVDCLAAKPKICVAFSTDYELRSAYKDVACSYSMRYRSVHLTGDTELLVDFDEKLVAMNLFMQKYTGKTFTYNSPAIKNVMIWKMAPDCREGKLYGYDK